MLAVGTAIGGYILEHELGAGGFGVVYRARDAAGRVVALKLYTNPGIPKGDERFLREVNALKQLDHPNIVGVHAHQLAERPWYLVMDLAPGRQLDAVLADRALAVDEVLHLALQLADALTHAHERGVFHRDVKPANLLIDDDLRLRLVDFGIAVSSDATRLTNTGMLAPATVIYAPPEWIDGAPDPARWDVYSLGVVLFEALTRQPAFPLDTQAPSQPQLLRLAMSKGDLPPLDPGDAFAPEVRSLVRALTHPDLDQRPGAMADVRDHVRAVLAGSPVDTLEPAAVMPSAPTYGTAAAVAAGGAALGSFGVAVVGGLMLVGLGAALLRDSMVDAPTPPPPVPIPAPAEPSPAPDEPAAPDDPASGAPTDGGDDPADDDGDGGDGVAEVDPPASALADPTPDGCGELTSLEPAALQGRLSDATIACLRRLSTDERLRQTERDQVSRVLLVHLAVHAETADCDEFDHVMDRHLAQIGRSDPEIMYTWARHLWKRHGDHRGAITWSTRALDERARWGQGEQHVERVSQAHELRTTNAIHLVDAAEERYGQSGTDEDFEAAEIISAEARTYALEWRDWEEARDNGDPDRPHALCLAVADEAGCAGVESKGRKGRRRR